MGIPSKFQTISKKVPKFHIKSFLEKYPKMLILVPIFNYLIFKIDHLPRTKITAIENKSFVSIIKKIILLKSDCRFTVIFLNKKYILFEPDMCL